MPLITPFDQWRAEQFEASRNDKTYTECPACEGNGLAACDCREEHCPGEKPCHRCRESGEIQRRHLKESDFTKHQYLQAVVAELLMLAEWQNKPPLHYIIEQGLAPYSAIGRNNGTAFIKDGYKSIPIQLQH